MKLNIRSVDATAFEELFESTVYRVFIDWTYDTLRSFFFLGVLLDAVVAATFTSFAILYRCQDNDALTQRAIVITLIAVPCLANLLEIFRSFSTLRSGAPMILIICPYVCIQDPYVHHRHCPPHTRMHR